MASRLQVLFIRILNARKRRSRHTEVANQAQAPGYGNFISRKMQMGIQAMCCLHLSFDWFLHTRNQAPDLGYSLVDKSAQ